MRIFKNRGDIFFSKTNKEKSTEQKILITALISIVLFTCVFLTVTAIKNNFSAKEFFAPEKLEVTQAQEEEYIPPQISGKTNYLVLVGEKSNLLFAVIIQTDSDNISYKLTSLKASTVIDGKSIADVYKKSSAQNVKTAVESMLSTKIDYYISMQSDKFAEIYSKFGEINYPVISDIKFKNNNSAVPYSLKIKEGEQKIKGSQLIGLMRYYLDEKSNTSVANDIFLSVVSQQINENNAQKSEELFQYFITNCETNITVKNFSASRDTIEVFSDERSGVNIYNAPAEYKNNKIIASSLKEIKGYFVK